MKIGKGIDSLVHKIKTEYVFAAEPNYRGGHYDHFYNFFNGIRNKTPLVADVLFGVRSAAPALLSYESYVRGDVIYWDAENFKEIKRKTFELFRNDSKNIEIITYRELHNRAKFIIENTTN